jgi:DNA invertase Pin-like site-specific DNA recombinase
MTKRAALYLRVSTDGQTVENQRRELAEAAERKGWTIVVEFVDQGISGAKSRDARPAYDAMLKQASLNRKKFDVVMAWSVDRLGRSLGDLVNGLNELRAAKIDLFLLNSNLDTTTPDGRAMFGMLGVFAEYERSMIVMRVKAGIARAQAAQAAGTPRYDSKGLRKKAIGRPAISRSVTASVRKALESGLSVRAAALQCGVSPSTASNINRASHKSDA